MIIIFYKLFYDHQENHENLFEIQFTSSDIWIAALRKLYFEINKYNIYLVVVYTVFRAVHMIRSFRMDLFTGFNSL